MFIVVTKITEKMPTPKFVTVTLKVTVEEKDAEEICGDLSQFVDLSLRVNHSVYLPETSVSSMNEAESDLVALTIGAI
jgi:hypothetical protein